MQAGGPAAHLSGVLLFGLPIPGTALPFHGVLTELHQGLSRHNVMYTVIGGVAVYLSKRAEYGEATAAHDLADVTALLTANPELRDNALLKTLHPSVQELLETTQREVERYRRKQPRNRSCGRDECSSS